ncbi:MAG: hypothetical protein K0R57_6366 [Paenibacillaceae bacterium]|nr:hypothetical protein [Paenibacillaceae bacterium]
MNKSRIKGLSLIVGVSVVLLLGVNTFHTNADSASPSSAQAATINDPLVTKSYLDQQLAELVAKEVAKQGGATTTTPKPTVTPQPQDTAKPESGSSTSTLTVVQLQTGQTLFAKAGGELIVRTGKTVAVSTDGDGIPDVTAGKDLAAGTAVELNHLLIFPRDGRGIKPDPKNKDEIYIMIRGGYSIQNADGTTLADH